MIDVSHVLVAVVVRDLDRMQQAAFHVYHAQDTVTGGAWVAPDLQRPAGPIFMQS